MVSSNYPDCKNSYPLPGRGLIIPTQDRCKACGHPVIKVITRGRPPWILCLNMECPAKNGKGKKTSAKAEGRPKKPARKRAASRKKKAEPTAVEAEIASG